MSADVETTRAPTDITAVMVSKQAGRVQVDVATIGRPSPGPGELLVQPAYVGICGSDLEQLADHLPPTFKVTYPHVLGHEWSGEVLEVDPGTDDFSPGDRVIGHGALGDNRWFGVTHDGAMAEAFSDPTVFSSTGAPRDSWAPALRMLERLQLDLRPLVSATLPFTDIEEALSRAADTGRETKVLVHP